jgi:poly-gamma-glutamate synthesis protein (capsule biosynthesis protein)
MRRAANLTLLLAICCLASCHTAGSPLPTRLEAVAPTAEPAPSRTPTALHLSEPDVTPTNVALLTPTFEPSPSDAPTAEATVLPQPTPTPKPTAMPRGTLPPLLPAIAGDHLPLSLGWRYASNGHLTGGLVTELAGRPTILLASLGRVVYALSEGGQLRWQARTRGPVYALAEVEGERIAVGDDAGHVLLLDGHGKRLWRHALGSRVTSLLGGWQGGLLAGGWDEHLSFLDVEPEAGRVVWQAPLQGPVSDIVALPGLAVVATLDGQVSAFDPSGTEVWRRDMGASVTGLGKAERGSELWILAALQDGRLLALNPDGSPGWQVALGTAVAGGPVWRVADLEGDGTNEIVVGLGDAEPLLALLSLDGEFLWRVRVPSGVNALSAVDLEGDGKPEILAGLSGGEVQAYDSQGRRRAGVHAGLPVWDLLATGDAAVALADVGAWRIRGVPGRAGSPWLLPPPLLSAAPDTFPGIVDGAGSGESDEDIAVLSFLGDLSPGRSMEAQLARYGAAYPWSGIGTLLADADLVVANLEGLLTKQGKPLDKSYLIRAHPRWGQTLAEADVDLVHLANNHALDFGAVGLDETLATLDTLGIAAVGAGDSAGEARQPARYDLNGVRVAVLGYAAARWNGSADVPRTDRVAWASIGAVEADVRAARGVADLLVVILHAGTEYASEPSPDQVAVAHAALDAGADLVVGHHPHVTQTIERYGDGLIVYSLGDALFDIPRQAAMQGHLLRVHATPAGLSQIEVWPFWIDETIRPRFLDDGTGAPRFSVVYP